MTLCPHHKHDISWAGCSADFTGCQVVAVRAKQSPGKRQKTVDIPDDIATLAVSRQRKIQLAWERLGLCRICGRPRDSNSATYCTGHAIKQREGQRKRRSPGSKVRYFGAASYRSEFEVADGPGSGSGPGKLQGLKIKGDIG